MKHLLESATICTYQCTYVPFELRNATSCGRDMSHESTMFHGNTYHVWKSICKKNIVSYVHRKYGVVSHIFTHENEVIIEQYCTYVRT